MVTQMGDQELNLTKNQLMRVASLAKRQINEEAELAAKRKSWNAEVSQKTAALKEQVEAPCKTDSAKLDGYHAIVTAYQDLDEAKAGRSTETHPHRDEIQKIHRAIQQELENAGQESLFPEDEEEVI